MRKSWRGHLFAFVATAAAACATSTTPGARPEQMSRIEHERVAQREQAVAAEHAAQFNPTEKGGVCFALITHQPLPCWRSVTNPTQHHLEEAWAHRKAAADHRAASETLRSVEASACAGVADEDRDMSPFDHREDIARVEALSPPALKSASWVESGAKISFRPRPGLTQDKLQRIVDCHLARNAALGYEVPEMPNCPLALKGVHATVAPSMEGGLSVTIHSDNPVTAKQILDRANALAPR